MLPEYAITREEKEEGDVLHVYKRRWYMLFPYCVANMLCEMAEFTFAAIQDKAVIYYGVSNATVSSMIVVSFIICTVLLLVAAFAADRFGMAKIHFLGISLILAGSLIRVFAWKSSLFWVAFVSQIFVGIGFPFIVDSTMTLIASNWFPENERATASSAAFVAMVAGNAVIEFLGPAIVYGVPNKDTASADEIHDALQSQFLTLYSVIAGINLVLALLTYFTFQGKPEKLANYGEYLRRINPPPPKSFQDFLAPLWACLKIGPFWPLFFEYGFMYGCVEAFLAVVNPVLVPLGYTTV